MVTVSMETRTLGPCCFNSNRILYLEKKLLSFFTFRSLSSSKAGILSYLIDCSRGYIHNMVFYSLLVGGSVCYFVRREGANQTVKA